MTGITEMSSGAAARTRQLPTGGLVALLGAARARGAVDLAVGTPGWPSPPARLINEACEVMRTESHQYEDPDGSPTLRSELATALGGGVDPDTELTVTVGGSEGLAVALLATVDPGDEVVLLEPCYENFLGAVALAGGTPRYVRTRPPDWRADPTDLAAAFGLRTKAILLNTPNNPTGHVLDAGELDLIAALCERWDVTVICDEVYAGYVFDGRKHLSVAAVPGLRERTVVIGSLSKSHAISGWRLGFLRASAARTAVLRQVHVATTAGAAGPLQQAVARAGVLGPDWDPLPTMQHNRDRAVEMFTRLGLRCPVPEGGCYALADIEPVTSLSAGQFAQVLLEDAGVAVVPGEFFFAKHGAGDPRLIRIAFNREQDTLDEARRRLAGFDGRN